LDYEFQKRRKCRAWISPSTVKRAIIGRRRRRATDYAAGVKNANRT
jgi:hypothetical protein